MSTLTLMPWVIVITAALFIALHGQRHHPVLAQLSIITGFIPVLVHELGHAITASLTRGTVMNIYMSLTPRKQLKTGAQGTAEFVQPFRTKRIPIAFMGYASPPLVLILGVFLATQGFAIVFAGLLLLGLLYYFYHTSQKWIPILLILIIAYSGFDMATADVSPFVINVGYSIILGLLAGESLQSIVITAQINFSRTKKPWDGVEMRKLTLIPATVWWSIWAAISILSVIISTLLLLN